MSSAKKEAHFYKKWFCFLKGSTADRIDNKLPVINYAHSSCQHFVFDEVDQQDMGSRRNREK